TLRNKVDLPQPEGPIKAVTLLFGIAMLMPCRACFAPYQRLKFSIFSTASSFATAACVSVGTGLPSAIASRRPPAIDGFTDCAACGSMAASAMVGCSRTDSLPESGLGPGVGGLVLSDDKGNLALELRQHETSPESRT